MKLLNKLTLNSLRLNKKRTIVTIIGIILATALIAAVSSLAVSFQWSMVEYEREKNGNYHYCFYNIPSDEIKYIGENRNVEDYFLITNIGYAKLDGSINEGKPYLYVQAMTESAFENGAMHLTEGRFPEKDGELVIAKHIKTNGGVTYEVGDTLTLDIGERIYSDGSAADQYTPYEEGAEELKTAETKTYEVVGIIERPSYNVEPRTAPGYSVFTYLDEENFAGNADVYALYTKNGMKNHYEVTEDIIGIEHGLIQKLFEGGSMAESDWEKYESAKYAWNSNRYLINYQLLRFGDSTMKMLYSVASIVILIIIFTSAFCIRNSFAISITEKMKQYGMLSSVGATPRQIKKNVYYEAFLLGIIGIPLGLLSGVGASYILIRVVSMLLKDALNIPLIFKIAPLVIVIAALLAVVVIMLSAGSPARRASKVSAIDAIRGSEDIKIKNRDVKIPKFIKKCFGMGGTIAYKNMKRNRKRYRVAIISIAVSVLVFIPLYYFMSLAFKSSEYYLGEQGYNLSVDSYNIQDVYDALMPYTKEEGVIEYSAIRNVSLYVTYEDLEFTEDYMKYCADGLDMTQKLSIPLYAIGEESYRDYVEELGLSYDKVKNQAIIINDLYCYDSVEEKHRVIDIYKEGTKKLNGDLAESDSEGLASEQISLPVALMTDEAPVGLEVSYYGGGLAIVSDEWLESHADYIEKFGRFCFDSEDPDALQELIQADEKLSECGMNNLQKEYRQNQSLFLVIAIFLYGFIAVISLIGITNIFNTITTCMELRSKEFAMLRSVGMTHKEFNRMVCLESVFYGTKALLIGVPIGILLSYLIGRGMAAELELAYEVPLGGILIAVAAVFILLFAIMRYSLKRIHKQNIIDTIRQDNI